MREIFDAHHPDPKYTDKELEKIHKEKKKAKRKAKKDRKAAKKAENKVTFYLKLKILRLNIN